MRNSLIISVFVFSIFNTAFAQESRTTCAKRNSFSNKQLKSPDLSPQQINEERKYDVDFYALDVKLNNLSSAWSETDDFYKLYKF